MLIQRTRNSIVPMAGCVQLRCSNGVHLSSRAPIRGIHPQPFLLPFADALWAHDVHPALSHARTPRRSMHHENLLGYVCVCYFGL